MSFNRLNYDTGTYKKDLNQSIGPGIYVLAKPKVNSICDKNNRRKKCLQGNFIDIDSELQGLNRKNTNNPSKKYRPKSTNLVCNGIDDALGLGADFLDDCIIQPEDTRLSNPPCTMRETEINRFDWLSSNPQSMCEIPFTHNISNRILVKDNHRPIIPNPISSIPVLPKQKGLTSETIKNVYANNTSPPSTYWKRCCSSIN